MKESVDLIERITEYVLSIQTSDMQEDDFKIAKMFLLDSIGVGFAGSTALGVSEMIEQLADWSGKQEAQLFAFPHLMPAPWAAYANALMIHARDFDDVHDAAGMHTNAPVLGTLLVVSKIFGWKLSGKDFLAAQIIGIDLAVRLALSFSHRESGWHASSIFGIIGAVAAGARIMGLKKDELVNAFGIAYSQMSGNRQCIIDGAITKRMQPAFAAQNAVVSLFYAKKGIQGAKSIIGGRYGLGFTYFDQNIDKDCLLHELGQFFEIRRLAVKPYPCCRGCHAAIDAALELRKNKEWRDVQFTSIKVYTSKRTVEQIGKPVNTEGMTHVDAQFSIPYTMAIAWLKGQVEIGDFIGPTLTDSRILDLAKKIEVIVDYTLQDPMMSVPQTIVFKAQDGRTKTLVIKSRTGSPEKPLSEQRIYTKFKNCLKYSIKPFTDKQIADLYSSIMSIDCINNINSELFFGK